MEIGCRLSLVRRQLLMAALENITRQRIIKMITQ